MNQSQVIHGFVTLQGVKTKTSLGVNNEKMPCLDVAWKLLPQNPGTVLIKMPRIYCAIKLEVTKMEEII